MVFFQVAPSTLYDHAEDLHEMSSAQFDLRETNTGKPYPSGQDERQQELEGFSMVQEKLHQSANQIPDQLKAGQNRRSKLPVQIRQQAHGAMIRWAPWMLIFQ